MAISARWYLPASIVAGFFLNSQAAAPAAQSRPQQMSGLAAPSLRWRRSGWPHL